MPALALATACVVAGFTHSHLRPIQTELGPLPGVPAAITTPSTTIDSHTAQPPAQPGPANPAAPVQPKPPEPTNPATPVDPHANPSGNDIGLAEAHRYFLAEVRFVDARPPEDFAAGHVAGAVNVTIEQAQSGRFPDIVQTFDRQAVIVVYCVGGDCDASRLVAESMRAVGFVRAVTMTASYDDWAKADYPIQTSGGTP